MSLLGNITEVVDPLAVGELLGESGAIERSDEVNERIQIALTNSGASPEEVAGGLSELANGAETESVRLSAIKLVMELHGGVIKKKESQKVPKIAIIFPNSDVDPSRTMRVLNPSR